MLNTAPSCSFHRTTTLTTSHSLPFTPLHHLCLHHCHFSFCTQPLRLSNLRCHTLSPLTTKTLKVNCSISDPLKVMISGAPASGKGTQCELIVQRVSSNFTTNENKGVSITRSHEVTGKSSTDGPSSTAGKPGNFSIDALAKAKKALQMQKELPEKLKKIPQLNKSSTQNLQGDSKLGSKGEPTAPSSIVGVTSKTSTSTSLGPVANMSIFPSTAPATFANSPASGTSATGIANVPNLEAVRRAQELAARLGFHPDPHRRL